MAKHRPKIFRYQHERIRQLEQYGAARVPKERKSGQLIPSRRNPYANERKAESYTMSCRIDRIVSAGDFVVLRVSGRMSRREFRHA